jgi:hypothetical protein
MLTTITGNSLNEISVMIGSSASGGISACAVSIRSRIFCSASSISTDGSNSIAMMLAPSAEVEVISRTSFNASSSSSSGFVTSVSMSDGATPMYGVVTITSGMVMSGEASRGRLV